MTSKFNSSSVILLALVSPYIESRMEHSNHVPGDKAATIATEMECDNLCSGLGRNKMGTVGDAIFGQWAVHMKIRQSIGEWPLES